MHNDGDLSVGDLSDKAAICLQLLSRLPRLLFFHPIETIYTIETIETMPDRDDRDDRDETIETIETIETMPYGSSLASQFQLGLRQLSLAAAYRVQSNPPSFCLPIKPTHMAGPFLKLFKASWN